MEQTIGMARGKTMTWTISQDGEDEEYIAGESYDPRDYGLNDEGELEE